MRRPRAESNGSKPEGLDLANETYDLGLATRAG